MKYRYLMSNWIFYTFIFFCFVVFFTLVHPIAPYDGDDWYNIIIERPPYPSLDYWNPTKVFPECFEPFIALLAANLIVPLVGDYINGLIVANAIIVSVFIIIYLLSVQRFIEFRIPITRLTLQSLMVVFILLHFLILRTKDECNEYLWYSNDANCYYHYIIPNMLCSSLVLWLMRNDIRSEKNGRTIATLLVLTYLALCSNLYSVVILIAYIGAILVLELSTLSIDNQKPSVSLKNYLHRNTPYLLVIVLWGIIQFIEANGIRANCYGYLHKSLILCIKVTVYNFFTIRYNLWFLGLSLLALFGAKLLDYKLGRHRFWHIGNRQIIILLAASLSIMYLILLSSRVDPTYIQRGDVIFEYSFFLLLLVIMALAYLAKHIKYVSLATLLLIPFLLFQINTPKRTFKDVCEAYAPDLPNCIRIDHEIVRQIRDADAADMDSVVISIPKYPNYENWPVMSPRYASQYYGRALYKHNQTKREIITIFIPSYEIEE